MASSDPNTDDVEALRVRNALLQEDIFLCILDCLDVALEAGLDESESRDARSVLFSLARTCRAFSEPSLDRLWCKLDSLDPLIQCYATVLDEGTAKTPPSQTEWAVIHRYSCRIRELKLPSTRFSLLFLRATASHPSPLVPNLRVLDWDASTFPPCNQLGVSSIQRLLSPALISLSVSVAEPMDGTLHSFLASHPFLCPNLSSCSIDLGKREDVSPTTIKILSHTITCYEHLKHLDIFVPINDVAVKQVTMSSALKTLGLVLQDMQQVCIASDATPFCNVKDLNLEVRDLDSAKTLLRPHDQMFHSFTLCCRSRPTAETILSFFIALASRQRTHSLRSVGLSSDLPKDENWFLAEDWEASDTTFHISLTTLRPLISLCHLRELHLNLSICFSFDDDDLISLTRNWPSLQALHLNPKSRDHDDAECIYPWESTDIKYVTFRGLLSLVKCCPELCELSLPVDARQLPIDFDLESQDMTCHSAIEELHFPESPIDDAHSVHAFLAQHFPSVSDVHCSFDLSSSLDGESEEIVGYYNLWDAVNAYLEGRSTPCHSDSDSDR